MGQILRRVDARLDHERTRKGDPDLPLTDAELDHKYRELAGPIIGNARANRLLGKLWELEALHTTRDLDIGAVRAYATTTAEVA